MDQLESNYQAPHFFRLSPDSFGMTAVGNDSIPDSVAGSKLPPLIANTAGEMDHLKVLNPPQPKSLIVFLITDSVCSKSLRAHL